MANPDYSIPELPYAIPPHQTNGEYDGAAHCEALYPTQRPPVPYNAAPGSVPTDKVSTLSENGFKEMRGMLTEGRYLVFELGSAALTNLGTSSPKVATAASTPAHDSKSQRWVAHAVEIGGDRFRFSSALDGRWLAINGKFVSDSTKAGVFTVSFAPAQGYALQNKCGKWLNAANAGGISWSTTPTYWKTFSVTYNN